MSPSARAQTVRNVVSVNGAVNAMVDSGGTLFLGGRFTQAGGVTGSAMRVDPLGVAPAAYPYVSGEVRAIVPDGSGGWFLGGLIRAVNGVSRHGIVHLRPDLSLDDWHVDTEERVLALARDGSRLYAGGEIQNIGGVSRVGLAAIDIPTASVLPFDAALGRAPYSTQPVVNGIQVAAGAVYFFGDFGSVHGATRAGLAKVDGVSGQPAAWNPSPNDAVYALAVQGDTVYVGGNFDYIAGQPRQNLVALSATTGAPFALSLTFTGGHNVPSGVGQLLVTGRTLWVYGFWTSVNGLSYSRIALDIFNGSIRPWNVGTVGAIARCGSKFVMGSIGPGTVITAMDTTANAAPYYLTAPLNDWTRAMAGDGTFALAGGQFSGESWVNRSRVLATDATTGALTPWSAPVEDDVLAMAMGGGHLYLAGLFGYIGGQTKYLVARLDPATGQLDSWDAQTDGYVLAMASDGNTLYMGGTFTSIGGQPRQRLAAFNAATGALLPWTASVNDQVDALLLADSRLYVAGRFVQMNGAARGGIGAVDPSSGALINWMPRAARNPAIPGVGLECLTVSSRGGAVFVGGSFDSLGGQPRSGLGAVSAASGLALPWNPLPPNGPVRSLFADSLNVYVGGEFDTIAGVPRGHVAAIDRGTGYARNWRPDADRPVLTMLRRDTTLWLAGEFALIANGVHSGIAGLGLADGFALDPPHASPLPVPPAGTSIELGPPWPQPSSGNVQLQLAVVATGPARVEVFDVFGRHVATLLDEALPGGTRRVVSWDGRGAHGASPNGLYFVTLATAGQRLSQRIVLAR